MFSLSLDEEKTKLLTEKIQIQDSLVNLRERHSNVEKKLSSEKSVTAALKVQYVTVDIGHLDLFYNYGQ